MYQLRYNLMGSPVHSSRPYRSGVSYAIARPTLSPRRGVMLPVLGRMTRGADVGHGRLAQLPIPITEAVVRCAMDTCGPLSGAAHW